MKPQSMDLKTRIAIVVIVIIVVPVVLTLTLFSFFTNYKVHQIGEKYGIENPTFASVYNNVELITRKIQEEYEKIQVIYAETPEKLEDIAFLRQMNEDMADNDAFVVVRKGERIYFNGSSDFTSDELLRTLPPLRSAEGAPELEGGYYVQTRDRSLFKQLDIVFSDGDKGSIFLISPTDRILPEIRTWATQMVVFVVGVLLATCIGMSLWLYRGIVRPLGELKHAAQNVRDGNLDFEVKGSGVEEVNDLCEDFEEMRVRLKESAEEKVQFDRENRELISNISHDLKTPLTTIRGYVEGVIDGVANTPEKLDRYMRTVNTKVVEMTRLLDELTVYSQIDTNKIPYTFARVKAADCFGECVEDLRLDLEEKNITLTYDNYLPEGTEVILDAEQLRRVVNNIIGNAVKYMDKPDGKIHMRLRDAGDFIQVEIEDNGRGIAREELPRIFDRFYRTDASRSTKEGGSGIGLSIVKKIIEDHEGRVWASSKEGVGTTVCFTFRKYVERMAEDEGAAKKEKRKTSRNRRKEQEKKRDKTQR